MGKTIITSDTNLLEYPVIDTNSTPRPRHEHLTIGDLHGNALKLIHILIHENILSISKEEYAELKDIYLSSDSIHPNTKDDFMRFEKIVENSAVCQIRLIRLLGDILADRGKNDYLTLLVLRKISLVTPLEIILSNHDIEFIGILENGFNQLTINKIKTNQSISFARFIKLFDHSIIDKQDVISLMDKYYLPHLKLLSATLHKDDDGITIYTHAPVGLKTICAASKEMNIAYHAGNSIQLMHTINKMNAKFETIKKNKQIYAFSRLDEVAVPKEAGLAYPIVRLIWNKKNKYSYVKIKKSYPIHYVHGHHDAGLVKNEYAPFVTNLDNLLGKHNRHEGKYIMYYTDDYLDIPNIANKYLTVKMHTKSTHTFFYSKTESLSIERTKSAPVISTGNKLN